MCSVEVFSLLIGRLSHSNGVKHQQLAFVFVAALLLASLPMLLEGQNTPAPPSSPAPPPAAGQQPTCDQLTQMIPQWCLSAICMVESKCNVNIGTVMDNDGNVSASQIPSIGPMQIKQMNFQDCMNGPCPLQPPIWQACCNQYQCSVNCLLNYYAKYRNNPDCQALEAQGPMGVCQAFSKVHNVGPTGCSASGPYAAKANGYWAQVQQQIPQQQGAPSSSASSPSSTPPPTPPPSSPPPSSPPPSSPPPST